jgi:hypothetical protein
MILAQPLRECVKSQESHPRKWVDGSDPTYQSQRRFNSKNWVTVFVGWT